MLIEIYKVTHNPVSAWNLSFWVQKYEPSRGYWMVRSHYRPPIADGLYLKWVVQDWWSMTKSYWMIVSIFLVTWEMIDKKYHDLRPCCSAVRLAWWSQSSVLCLCEQHAAVQTAAAWDLSIAVLISVLLTCLMPACMSGGVGIRATVTWCLCQSSDMAQEYMMAESATLCDYPVTQTFCNSWLSWERWELGASMVVLTGALRPSASDGDCLRLPAFFVYESCCGEHTKYVGELLYPQNGRWMNAGRTCSIERRKQSHTFIDQLCAGLRSTKNGRNLPADSGCGLQLREISGDQMLSENQSL